MVLPTSSLPEAPQIKDAYLSIRHKSQKKKRLITKRTHYHKGLKGL